MKLYEFQGKKIFKEYGIPIQSGKLIYPHDSLENLSPPLVLKSQVLTGGRGKAGGIKIWDGSEDLEKIVSELFHLKINNEQVKAILALESVDISREIYLSLTFNKSKATPILIAGISGGIDIEKTAQKDNEQIFFIEFNSLLGISDFQIRQLSKRLNIANLIEFRKIILSIYRIFKEYDASLVEINPLAITSQGLIAIDSKIELDDNASFRHQELYKQLKEEVKSMAGDDVEIRSEEDTITYVSLHGDIGVVSDGAGTGLLTLDLLAKYGGKVANFCELGGITNSEVVYKALKKVYQDPSVKCVLVVLIGGFNRMDEWQRELSDFIRRTKVIPLFIRMCGTKENEGKN
jgi:succinyl-CoA synthetase beta subunit